MKIQTALSTLFVTGVGLILIGQTPAAFAQGEGQDDQANQPSQAKEMEGDQVQFSFESAKLDSAARSKLDEVAQWAMADESHKVIIAGHFKEMGTEKYNKELGAHRARATKDYLVGAGVPADRIQVLGYGETMPAEAVSGPNAKNYRAVYLIEQEKGKGKGSQEGTQDQSMDQQSGSTDQQGAMQGEEAAGAGAQGQADQTGQQPYDQTGQQPYDQTGQQPYNQPETTQPVTPSTAPIVPGGLSFNVGGGVLDYFDSDTRDVTGTAGTWEARLAYGTRSIIGVEAGYVGWAQSVSALGLDSSADIVGTIVEGDVRINLPYGNFTPYVFGGAGWTRFNIVNKSFNTSDLRNSDNAAHFPVGAGFSYNWQKFLFDARGTIRPTVNDNMLRSDVGTKAGLTNWSVVGRVGWEF